MRFDSYIWLMRVRAVEREYLSTGFAINALLDRARVDPMILGGDFEVRDLVRSAENLEGTYLVRMFSEFETGLRAFWDATRHKESPSRTQDLINGISAQRQISDPQCNAVHAVREYRNLLVHEREEDRIPITLARSRRSLCTFLSYLR